MLQEHFKGPRKKGTKECCLFKQSAPWDLHPRSICQFINVGRVKQKSILYEGQPNSSLPWTWKSLTVKIIRTTVHKLGLCRNCNTRLFTAILEDEKSKSTLATTEGSFLLSSQKKKKKTSRQITDTIATAVQYDNTTPNNVSHNSYVSIQSTHTREPLVTVLQCRNYMG